MKRRSTFSIISLMAFTLIVTGCSTNVVQTTPKSQEIAKTNTVSASKENPAQDGNLLTVTTNASLLNYDSVESLVNKSTVIVEGVVVGLDYFEFNTNTFTKAKIKITNSFTDTVKTGEVLSFVDVGGITTQDKVKLTDGFEGKPGTISPIIENDKNTKVQILLNGSPLLKLNDQVVLFGSEDKEDFYNLSEKYYDIVGSYQGRFNVKEDTAERYSFEGSPSLKMPKIDLEEKIKKLKK